MAKVVNELLDDSDEDMSDVVVPRVGASLVPEVEGISTCCIVWDIGFVTLLDASEDLYVIWMTSIIDGCTTTVSLIPDLFANVGIVNTNQNQNGLKNPKQ